MVCKLAILKELAWERALKFAWKDILILNYSFIFFQSSFLRLSKPSLKYSKFMLLWIRLNIFFNVLY
jgi:hypothetical protein